MYSYIYDLLVLQIFITALMLPLSIKEFGTISWIGIGLNVIAIPIVSFVLLPICLIGALALLFDLNFHGYVFSVADYLFNWLLVGIVNVTEQFDQLVTRVHLPTSVLLTTLGELLVYSFPRFKGQLYLAALLSVSLVTHLTIPKPIEYEWKVHVLDVGQGTSVLITQNERAILIDTGNAYPNGFNMADSVIIPVLSGLNIKDLDTLVLSHSDSDHAGSAPIVRAQVPILRELTYRRCRGGQSWQWGRLIIKLLWPLPETMSQEIVGRNETSCVLHISDGHRSILLPGDIGRQSEQRLVDSLGYISPSNDSPLKADILIAPHHGSKTSSSLLFVKHVQPRHVVFTTGQLNRWHFPHPEVFGRYKRLDIETWNTAQNGYIRFDIPFKPSETMSIYTYRESDFKRWYH